MALDGRLVLKGKDEPRDGLAQQGKVHVELAKLYATELEGSGWSAADTEALAVNVGKLEQAVGRQAAAEDHAAHSAVSESQAVDNAKAYIRKLRNALPRAFREVPALGVTLNAALKPPFRSGKASKLLNVVKGTLGSADARQGLARKETPGETLALYEVMGKVLEQIEDLNRAGKSAFAGDAATGEKFNKDILLRARKEQVKKKAEEAPKGGEAPPAS